MAGSLSMTQVNKAFDQGIICTVIMPIYNRKDFLKQAFSSLQNQTYLDWRLIIVDDGSTDSPLPLIKSLSDELVQPIYYIKQENKGPGAARQTGINASPECEYFAFFDSDDEWLPSYLDDAITRLNKHLEIDWLYVACKRIQHDSRITLQDSTFWSDSNTPVNFFNLETCCLGDAFCFTNNKSVILEQIKEPINAGFQNSVMRSKLFHTLDIPDFRIGEDRHLVISTLAHDFKMAYFDKANVLYHVHDNNISDTNSSEVNYQKKLFVQEELFSSYQDLVKLDVIDKDIQRALKKACANILFWHIAYQIYLPQSQHILALKSMLEAMSYNPRNMKFYKTTLIYFIRLLFKRQT